MGGSSVHQYIHSSYIGASFHRTLQRFRKDHFLSSLSSLSGAQEQAGHVLRSQKLGEERAAALGLRL